MKTVPLRRRWARWLRSCGIPDAHVAALFDVDVETIVADLTTRRGRRRVSPPFRRPNLLRPILGQAGRHVRKLHDLGYDHETIGRLLALAPSPVADFLTRLEPLRRPRANPDRLTTPRDHREESDARAALQRAAERRQDRQAAALVVDPAVVERKAMLRLQRSPVDAWGSRGVSTEVADHARLLDAIRTGRLSGAELVGLASRVYYAGPQGSAPRELPTIEPAIWTGDVGLHVSGSRVLTDEQIFEAADLLRSGVPWDHVAKRFGVAENTLRRCLRDIKTRRELVVPLEPATYSHGVVRWDLPLVTGGKTKVWVDCECGRRRLVEVRLISRPDRRFTAMCSLCFAVHRHKMCNQANRKAPPERAPLPCPGGRTPSEIRQVL